MKNLNSNEIRKIWINFFKSKKHFFEKGVSLIPDDDPSLLWINSGVAGLKKYFDGRKVPKNKRIVNIQKSIRTNDIENVGKTSRHHTFFEMLGNFSIGDYFRDEAIEFAFEILTSKKFFFIPKDKIYITYYCDDTETANKWLSLGIKKDHLIPNKNNFWEIGEGPCGPNTEIFFDRGEKYDINNQGISLLINNIENDRFIEIWNIVFSQFNAKNGVKREDYKELPNKNIDTGAGLERLACIFQNKETNFETDLFLPIINQIEHLTHTDYISNKVAFRIIADHIKACVFALCDGAMFSNEKNGYVLRRLLRRSMYYGHKINNNFKPFLFNLVDVISNVYKKFYPEIYKKKDFIKETIKQEEEKFLTTLSKGSLILKEMIKNKNIDAFKLYDTYGFPIELTEEEANKNKIKIDLNDFKQKMQKQQQLARKNIKQNKANDQSRHLLEFIDKSSFTYKENDKKGKVIGIFKNGVAIETLCDTGEIIFDKTNFYAESGGQICDTGIIKNNSTTCIVEKVIKAPNGQHLHFIKVLNGVVSKNDIFFLKIDKNKRQLASFNHTAVHLLQATMCKILSPNIEQKGSYVSDAYLHFDFNYHQKIALSDLKRIEQQVNEQIFNQIDVKTKNVSINTAKKNGAKMLFLEKYGKIVRIVKIGNYSLELCGGTHAKNTKDIGIFKIISEESIASGIRRITAITSKNAYISFSNDRDIIDNIASKINVNKETVTDYIINNLIATNNLLKTKLKKTNLILAECIATNLQKKIITKQNYNFLITEINIDNNDRDMLVTISDFLIKNISNYLIILIGKIQNNNFVFITTDIKKINSQSLMKKICEDFNGKGGGSKIEARGQIMKYDINKINKIASYFLNI